MNEFVFNISLSVAPEHKKAVAHAIWDLLDHGDMDIEEIIKSKLDDMADDCLASKLANGWPVSAEYERIDGFENLYRAALNANMEFGCEEALNVVHQG